MKKEKSLNHGLDGFKDDTDLKELQKSVSSEQSIKISDSDNIPPLRFPEFQGEWEKKKLGEISDKIMYGMNSAAIPFDGENKYLRITDIDESSREFNPKPLVSPDGEIEEKYKLKYGDIVFTRTGASVGKTYLYNPKDGNLLYAGFLIKFSITKGNPYFIFSQTLKEDYNKWVVKMSMRSGQPGLNAEECKDLKISFPSLPEQTKIATFLTAIDEKIQALKKKHSLLAQYKKGVMQGLFCRNHGFDGLTDDTDESNNQKSVKSFNPSHLRFRQENGEEFPEWEVKKGGELFESISNKNHNSDLPILAISQELGAVPREIINYQISVTDKSVESYKVVHVGDFIISLRSFQGGIEYSNYKGICSPAYVILRNTAPINNIFYKYYFKTDFYIQRLCEKLEGIRDGKMISYKYFSEIELPYPSIPEQTRIANFLSALDEKITHTATQIEKMEVWKKGLLQKMFV